MRRLSAFIFLVKHINDKVTSKKRYIMFESSINVKLKTLFDKIYLSRNKFEKMVNLLSKLEYPGEYSIEKLIVEAEENISKIEHALDRIDEVDFYNEKIDEYQGAYDLFIANKDQIVTDIINHFSEILDKILNDIESIRITTSTNDNKYENLEEITNKEYNESSDFHNIGFIPTDDYYPWNSLKKTNIKFSDIVNILSEEKTKIDPLGECTAEVNTGNKSTKDLSYSPIILDMITNVKNGGFSLSSINCKNGNVYTRIEDNYQPEIFVNKKMSNNKEVALTVREPREIEISIRRHGELGNSSPTKFYSSIKK